MFAARYYPNRMFAPRYFPKVRAVVVTSVLVRMLLNHDQYTGGT